MKPAKPQVVVLAPEPLFRSFFDAPRLRRLERAFRWRRVGARREGPALWAALEDADALITTWDSPPLAESLLEEAPRLRVIAHCGGEVKARFACALFSRITITNAPGPMAPLVAELAVTFLLYAARNVDAYRATLRRRDNGVYRRLHRDGAGEETILGQTVGLLGFGKIGQALAALLKPFGVRLLVHDPYADRARARQEGGMPVSFSRLLDESRHLILAAALTEKTRGLLDARALARLPDGATAINVARGGLVDLEALTREVQRGRLRCALDVTDPEEPLPMRHSLRRARGVLLTPHVGAAQRSVRHAMAAIVLDDLERFFRGERVAFRVTPGMLRRMT